MTLIANESTAITHKIDAICGIFMPSPDRMNPMYRGVLIGAGGFASAWARTFLPAFRDRLEMVGIADIAQEALHRSADALNVPSDRRFASATEMLDAVEADICFIVIQPGARTEMVRQAAQRGMAILCEKPIGASWEQSLEIATIARDYGTKLAVMQNYRESNRIRALKCALQRSDLGRVNVAQCRMAVDHTIETAGGAFRHQVPDAFIYEGAEHHLDQIRNLLDADAEWVQGVQWNQPWSTFNNNPCLLLTIGMTTGAVVQYEMNHIERGHQNGWHQEYYRLSCEGGTLTLDADHVIRLTRHLGGGKEEVEDIQPDTAPRDGHVAQIQAFLDWLDGGPAPVTVPEDNLRTMALIFAAIEATHTGQRVSLSAYPIPVGLTTRDDASPAVPASNP
jgi:predicted dehydrogenase